MNADTFMGLINNAALLLALALLYDSLPNQKTTRRWLWNILTGLLVGLIGIAVMLMPWRFSAGVIFDTRSILLSLTGVFFGPIPTLIASFMTVLLRVLQGGAGTLMGVGVILTSSMLGVAWSYFLKKRKVSPRWYGFYGFGLLVHITMLLWTFVLPREIGWDVLKTILVPVILIYPVGTVLLGLQLDRQRQRKEWEQALRQERDLLARISGSMQDALLLTMPDGSVYSANPAACRMFGCSEQEIIQTGRNGIVAFSDPRPSLALEEQLRTGRFVGELDFVREDGQTFVGEVASSTFRDHDGRDRTSMIIRDITERKQAEEALRESEQFLISVLDGLSNHIAVINASGEIVLTNKAYREFAAQNGIDPRAVSEGTNYISVCDSAQGEQSEEAAPFGEAIRQVLDGSRASFEMEYPCHSPDMKRWFIGHVTPFQSDGPRRAVISHENVTARKRAEEILRESELLFRQTFDMSPVGIVMVGLDKRFIRNNHTFSQLLGYGLDELVGKTIQDVTYPDDKQIGMAEMMAIMKGEDDYSHVEKRYLRKDGQIVWGEVTISLIRDSEANAQYFLAIIQDITERKAIEEQLRENEARFRRLHESMMDCFVQMDMPGKIGDFNPAYREMLGYPAEELYQLCSPDLTPACWHAFEQSIVEEEILPLGHSKVYEKEYIRKDGSVFPVELRAFLLRDPTGTPTGMWAIVRDITARKQTEQRIRDQNAELERRVEARTRELGEAQEKLIRQEKLAVMGQLAGGVGHELRNPLGVINNATYYLRLLQPEMDEKVREYLGIIETETHTAEKIINDLLDFSRIKSVDPEPFSAAEIVRRALDRYPVPQNIAVILKLPEALPPCYADPRQVVQVLGNLVVNACQAMPEGGKLALTGRKKGKMLAISVSDSGVGIQPENMGKLFEPLYTTKPKGIGLGLAVSKKLIEANGGRIEVTSVAGKGSVFTVLLPKKTMNMEAIE